MSAIKPSRYIILSLIMRKFKTVGVRQKRPKTLSNNHGRPPMVVKRNPLLINAAEVYTFNIFFLFQNELLESLCTEFAEQSSCVGNVILSKLKSHNPNSRVRKVEYDGFKEDRVGINSNMGVYSTNTYQYLSDNLSQGHFTSDWRPPK